MPFHICEIALGFRSKNIRNVAGERQFPASASPVSFAIRRSEGGSVSLRSRPFLLGLKPVRIGLDFVRHHTELMRDNFIVRQIREAAALQNPRSHLPNKLFAHTDGKPSRTVRFPTFLSRSVKRRLLGFSGSLITERRPRGAVHMQHYRLYCFDGANKISGVHEIEAENDALALEESKSIKPGVRCELWQRERLVGRIDRDQT